jgi:hypothetical protein
MDMDRRPLGDIPNMAEYKWPVVPVDRLEHSLDNLTNWSPSTARAGAVTS